MTAKIVLDLLLVVMMLYGIFMGYKRGFVRVIFRKFRWLTTLVLSLLLARPIGGLLRERLFLAPVSEKLRSVLTEALGDEIIGATAQELTEQVPLVLRGLLNLLGIDFEQMALESGMTGAELLEYLVEMIASPVAMVIGVIVAFFALFILLRLCLGMVASLVSLIFRAPGLRTVNRLLGVVFGGFFAFLTVWFTVTVLNIAFEALAAGDIAFFAGYDIEDTLLAKYFNQFRPLDFILAL